MLGGSLGAIAFKFIGANVPEGHQGQTIHGMTQGGVLEKLRNGFHKLRVPWGFNADHQPVGGKFDVREEALVSGSIFASYITFDISHELEGGGGAVPACPAEIRDATLALVEAAGVATGDGAEFDDVF
jgi:hypothetical protein